MRLGQKNGLVRQWARRGSRPRQPKDQRYKNVYLFGAICPARGTGAALVLPRANTHAMQAHLWEISRTVAAGAHAALLLDRAGWHTTSALVVPDNLTLVLTNMANRSERRTRAAEYGAYSRQPAAIPQQAPAPQPQGSATSVEAKLDTLDDLAAKGYISKEEYERRRQAILDSL